MSVISLQLGQCGNQIGTQLFSTLYEDATAGPGGRHGAACQHYCSASLERFFQGRRRGGRPRARAVLVDMESKVVNQCLLQTRRSGAWCFSEASSYSQKAGSGNNWANGYLCLGPAAADRVLEAVRWQAERCQAVEGFLVLMSVAGGTGSGMGAFLTEQLKDLYPSAVVVSHAVWPFLSGEVSVQGYNALLSTAHLSAASDAIVVSQNDLYQQTCAQLLHLKNVSFADINRAMCRSIAATLQPASPLHQHNSQRSPPPLLEGPLVYQRCSLGEMATLLCPSLDHRLLTLKSVPQIPTGSKAYSTHLWQGLLRHLQQMLVTDSPIDEGMDWKRGLDQDRRTPLWLYGRGEGEGEGGRSTSHFCASGVNRCLSNLLVLRGKEVEGADCSSFFDSRLYAPGLPVSLRCSVKYQPFPFL